MNQDEFIAAVRANPINRQLLERLPRLALPDAWLVSGALFQTVWNVHTGRDPTYGIRDYDIFYFDPDTTYEAEDRAITMARTAFVDLNAVIEVRNQARVHLWYEAKFTTPYPALSRATDGIDRFLMPCAQVGIRPRDSIWEIYAPAGFEDLAAMIVRPNLCPNFHPDRYREKAERWKAQWPELTVVAS
jgi:hypothetical protein